MKYISAVSITILLLSAVIISPVNAALIHPDVMGSTVWFRSIEESSPTGDPLPLYGQPSANGDELLFPTTGNFSANSLGGGLPDATDGKLTLMIVAKPGNVLDTLEFAENGLTTLNAPFGGDAFAEVVSFAVVKVAEIAGVPVNLPAVNFFFNINPLNGQYKLSVIGGSSYASGWTGAGHLLLPENTTKVNVALDNNLFASTLGGGTRAFIDKKFFEIDVDTHLVPEPSTFLLVMLSVLFGAAVRKRMWR